MREEVREIILDAVRAYITNGRYVPAYIPYDQWQGDMIFVKQAIESATDRVIGRVVTLYEGKKDALR